MQRGTRSTDDTGVNEGATRHLQPILLQILIHLHEQLIAQMVLFHEMAELADCCLIGRRLPAEIDAGKPSQRRDITEHL